MALLHVEDLETHFISRNLDNEVQVAHALNRVSFAVDRGQVLGLVGETGAGKSLTAQSVMGLLRPPARRVGGRALFEGKDLFALPADTMNAMRGRDIALVVQNPRTSLDPLTRIGDQLIRVQKVHRKVRDAQARASAIAMLDAVGIPEPTRRMRAWPHELSGGMAQRVLIAMALINDPKLLIADEPTTGLDVTVQAQILDLLRDLVIDRDMAAIVITHDLGVVAHYCDRVVVMFAGGIVEAGSVGAVFGQPSHPYTRALLAATPERLSLGVGQRFGGAPPDLFNLPQGCHYRDRCGNATELCHRDPPFAEVDEGHQARCHFAPDLRDQPL